MAQTQTGFGATQCPICHQSTRGGHVCPKGPLPPNPLDLGDPPVQSDTASPGSGPAGFAYPIAPGRGGFSFDPQPDPNLRTKLSDSTAYASHEQMWAAFDAHWPAHESGTEPERTMRFLEDIGMGQPHGGAMVCGTSQGYVLIDTTDRPDHPVSVYADDTMGGPVREIRVDTDDEAQTCAEDFISACEALDLIEEWGPDELLAREKEGR